MAKINLTDISAGYLSLSTYNANNTLLEAAIEKTLSRDGTSPNTMSANLDLNSNRIVNLTDGANNQDVVTVAQLNAASVVANTTTAALTTLADAGTNYAATTVEGAFTELASVSNGEGASVIGLEDSAGNVSATDVEAAIAEIYSDHSLTTDLVSTSNTKGASLIGIEDTASKFAGTNLEVVLTDIGANYSKRIDAESVTATNVITAAESGRTFFLNSATEFVSTLPAAAIGLKYTFIVIAAPSGASYTIVTNSSANVMSGVVLDIVGELVYATARDLITFVDGVSLIGDRVDLISDGTNWYYKAFSGADGGITTGQT